MQNLFEIAPQDEGREEEDNTQSEIVLCILSVAPGKFNHILTILAGVTNIVILFKVNIRLRNFE